MKWSFTLYHLLILIELFSCKILFVFEMFRHGTRSPLLGKNMYKTEYEDIFHVKWKENGKLTSMGLRMQYILGMRNRMKYADLIDSIVDPREINVVSTVTSRSIASAQAHLMGMFPPKSGGVIDESEKENSNPPIPIDEELGREIQKLGIEALPNKIQTIPISYFELKEIFTILVNKELCPKVEEYRKKNRKHQSLMDFYTKVNKTYGVQLMKFFNKNSTDFIFDYRTIFEISDNFVTAYESKKNLSNFESFGIDLKMFNEFAKEMRTLFLLYTENTEELSPLSVSYTLPKVINWMQKRIESDKQKDTKIRYDEPKIVIYSGHDSTLSPFQLFFKKVFNTSLIYPNFGANLFLELHKNDSSGDYYVEYLFNGETMLKIPFEEFKKNIMNNIWDESTIREKCFNSKFNSTFFIIAGVITIVIILIGCYSICSLKKAVNQKKKEFEKEKGEEMIVSSTEEKEN